MNAKWILSSFSNVQKILNVDVNVDIELEEGIIKNVAAEFIYGVHPVRHNGEPGYPWHLEQSIIGWWTPMANVGW